MNRQVEMARAIRAIADVIEYEPERVIEASLNSSLTNRADPEASPVRQVVSITVRPRGIEDFTNDDAAD